MACHESQLGRTGENIPWLTEAYDAARLASPYPIATEYLGSLHRDTGRTAISENQTEIAIREYGRSLELQPDNLEALNSMGTLLWDADRPEEALDLFKRSFEIDRSQIYPLPYLTDNFVVRGELPRAMEYNNRCLLLDENYAPCVEQRDYLRTLTQEGL